MSKCHGKKVEVSRLQSTSIPYARAPWKEYRLRVASDDGWWWFFCGTFFGVQRAQCDVKHDMAFDLQIQTVRLLHKNPADTKHCEPWTRNTANREQTALQFVSSDVAISNLKLSAEQDRLSGNGAGYTLVQRKSSRPVWADCKALWAHDVNQPWCFLSSRHFDGDRTIPHTSQATHLCGIGDGSGGLAVLVCASWSLVVSSLFLSCWLFCLSWFYTWLVVFPIGSVLIVLVYIFVVGWFILRFLCWVFWLVSLFIWFHDLFVLDFGYINNFFGK